MNIEGMERANKREVTGAGPGARARAGKLRLRERAEVPEVLDLGRMVKTVSTMRKYVLPLISSPDSQAAILLLPHTIADCDPLWFVE